MRAGRVMGVDLYVNNFFLLLLALFFIAGVLGKGLIAFSVVLIHEFAHVAAARRLGVPVSDVELLPFGGVTRMGGDLVMDPVKEVYVAAAGPASNLIMAALGVAMKNYGLWHNELGPFFLQCNLLIAAFNLLPALPLDGGRVYRAHLARQSGIREATCRAAGLGQWWAAAIAVLGAAGLVTGYSGLDILITGLFLFYAATRERSMAPYLFMGQLAQKKSELFRAGVLPAEIMVSLEDVLLKEIIKPFLPRKFHLVLVLNRQWQYRGMVTEAQIIDGLLAHGLDLPVGKLPPVAE
ncbi:M50 family metallopeptidase [Desulfotomaculum copahuensis]|uniref:Peptidase M50 n=1 Tax=Desulfotomaculum copahuensis TaxID=1838280 RepID=A0A1B7LHI4_9FIRM|nr:M50 family metallopeptidase [Desulfotomaculum copahuensis]OAT85568.1 peptidase M50 [Desulfotomaculum copahuensis]